MRKTWGWMNLGLCLVFLALWFRAESLASIDANMRVTALDRAGVIDSEKLRQFDPALAENVRYNVGMWVTQPVRETAAQAAVLGAIATAVTGLILVLSNKDTEQTGAGPGDAKDRAPHP